MGKREADKCPYCGGKEILLILREFSLKNDKSGDKVCLEGCYDLEGSLCWFCKRCGWNPAENESKDWLVQKNGKALSISYDWQVDALYISLSGAQSVAQRQVTQEFFVDLDDAGNVIGIEILDACATYGQAVTTVQYGWKICKNSVASAE